nr:hypothetical protein [Tanacetum cinerariifolium]
MTKPHLTPFPSTTPRARVFAPFVIIFDFDDEITTLRVKPAPPSPDHIPDLYGYPLDSGDDSSDDVLSETAEAESPSTYHPLLPSEIPSLSSPPSLLTSLSSPPPSLLPSISHKRSRSPSPLLASLVSPSPPPTAVPPPLEHIESVGYNIETLSARVRSLEQHDVVTRESLRIAICRIIRS